MRIGEVARRAGVSTKAVRHYESLGLISAARLANGYRDFGERDVQLVRAALLQRLRQAAYRTSAANPPPFTEGDTMKDLYRLPSDLPVPVDDGAADHLPGTPMPQVSLPSTDGDLVGLHTLGEGRSVVYLYPLTGRPEVEVPDGWDNIPGARGCTPQACDFRDHHSELLAAGAARVFGLSSQETEYQSEVVDRLHLPFNMLSDTGLRLAATLGLPTFEFAGRTLYKRLTLIINNHVIEHAFYPVFPPDEHAGQILRWLHDHR